MAVESKRFISPYDDAAPAGAEGWEELYPYFLTFRDNLREAEEAKFWFADLAHWPRVFKPFDTIMVEYACKCLGQYNTRHYMIPPANGIDYRVHNGYLYMSPVAVPEAEIGPRVPVFLERAGHYFQNWPTLLENWQVKIKRVIEDLEALEFEPIPDVVPADWVTGGKGLDNTFDLIRNYNRAIELAYEAWQYHFEFLNLGYAAYLDFFGFCKAAWPSIPDLAIAKMVAGVDVDLFRPDDELKKLARQAVSSGIADRFASRDVEETCQLLKADEAGQAWIAQWDAACEPWFNFSTGSGFYHSDKIWIQNVEVPFGYIADYIDKVKSGADLDRPVAALHAERDRVVSEYRDLLATDEDRAAFDAKLGLSRTVFPYVENHNFYVEHWAHSVIWRKMRAFGEVLQGAGFIAEVDDIFLLRRYEVSEALFDYYSAWSVGAPSRGPGFWGAEIEARKATLKALREWSAPPALGIPPEVVTEPFTVMLWGITSDSVSAWLNAGEDGDEGGLKGFAASPGLVEGPARVIFSADQIGELQDGEILVAPLTAPSWAPVFGKIKATVTDVGGMMSHAAIVCREYGLPAVTGTAFGTKRITTGQMLRVDGNTGQVTILD